MTAHTTLDNRRLQNDVRYQRLPLQFQYLAVLYTLKPAQTQHNYFSTVTLNLHSAVNEQITAVMQYHINRTYYLLMYCSQCHMAYETQQVFGIYNL